MRIRWEILLIVKSLGYGANIAIIFKSDIGVTPMALVLKNEYVPEFKENEFLLGCLLL
jgi:hypothetical protein